MRIVLLNENVPVQGHFHRRRFCIHNTNDLKQDLVLSANIFFERYFLFFSFGRFLTVEMFVILRKFYL